jgi:hypothetical protein
VNNHATQEGGIMRTQTWEKIYDAPGGQRFFVHLIDGEREAIPRVAVADRSGTTPDKTEDGRHGVLWIDLDRKWYVNDKTFSIPVKRTEGDTRDYWCGESNEHLFALLARLREPHILGETALNIKVALSSADAGTGARAILKCLALGVQP